MECPRCQSDEMCRIQRVGFLQMQVFPLFGFYPWMCRRCRLFRMKWVSEEPNRGGAEGGAEAGAEDEAEGGAAVKPGFLVSGMRLCRTDQYYRPPRALSQERGKAAA